MNKLKSWEFQVIGMHCGGCEKRIFNALMPIEEIKNVKANHKTGKVEITLNCELTPQLKEKVKKQLAELEFEVEK